MYKKYLRSLRKCWLPLKKCKSCIWKFLSCIQKSVQRYVFLKIVHNVFKKCPTCIRKCFMCALKIYIIYQEKSRHKFKKENNKNHKGKNGKTKRKPRMKQRN